MSSHIRAIVVLKSKISVCGVHDFLSCSVYIFAFLSSGQISCEIANVPYFSCPSGKCLRTDLLCDSDKNCDDGTDEMRCGKGRFKEESLIFS